MGSALVYVLVVGVALFAIAEPITPAGGTVSFRPQRVAVPAQVRGVFVSAAIAGFAGFAVLGLFTVLFADWYWLA